MTPDQIQLLRRLALNDAKAMSDVLTGEVAEFESLEPRVAALVRIAAVVGVVPDAPCFRWEMDEALAVGVEDDQIFAALMVAAPIIGVARLTSALPHLMEALDLEVVES